MGGRGGGGQTGPAAQAGVHGPGGRRSPGLGWAAAYAVAVVAGRQLLIPGTELALFWPAAGIAAAWTTARWGTRSRGPQLGALAVLSAALDLLLGLAPAVSGLLAGAAVVQGVTYALTVRWLGRHEESVSPVVRVLLGSLASSVASAPLGVAAAAESGVDVAWVLLGAWVARNGCGAFVVVSTWVALLGAVVEHHDLGQGRGRLWWLSSRVRPRAAAEYAVALVVTTGVTTWVFGTQGTPPLAFLVLATSVWVGSRFSPLVAAVHSAALTLAVVLATTAGRGPFGTEFVGQARLLVVQLFVLLCCVQAQLLSAGLRDRHRLLRRALASEAEERSQRATLDAVLGVLHDGLVVVDGDGNFVVRNPAAVAMAPPEDRGPDAAMRTTDGYGLTEVDGSPVAPERRPSVLALRGRTVVRRLLLRLDPGTGRRSVLSVSAAPLDLPDEEGHERRLAVMTMQDVTREHDQLTDLRGFAGVVAHDLRNPLAAAMSWAEVADEELDRLPVDASAARGAVQHGYAAAVRAMDLLGELLAYAEAQDRPLALARVDLGPLVDEVGDEVRQRHPAARVEHGDLDPVCGDPVLVRQLLSNLLGNAAKYVAPGTRPQVRVASRRVGDRVVVEVVDNGIGIDRQHRARVFEGFFRAPTERPYPGTGLGLAICARVVERHGGQISVHDAPGSGGSLVRFDLGAPT